MSENNRNFYDCDKEELCRCENKGWGYKHDEFKCCSEKERPHHPPKEDLCKCEKERHYPPLKKDHSCCCKLSMLRVLELLNCDEFVNYVNFNQAGFISDHFVVGTTLKLVELGPLAPTSNDNLTELNGTLGKVTNCTCDLLDISGSAIYALPLLTVENVVEIINELIAALTPIPGTAAIIAILKTILNTINDAILEPIVALLRSLLTPLPEMIEFGSLCNINAIALDTTNYVKLTSKLKKRLNKDCCDCCKEEEKHEKCEPCCCNDGIQDEILEDTTVSLTAGPLILNNAEVIGKFGNVLLFGVAPTATTPGRIYLVCTDSIAFF
ncbi:CotA family spore coat protein [Romboutsia lituseburensis]|uniref:Uncharacterized protein n=1 Tax=Romboutsia lituseburensis DSM 797 TaxID=1121325 RepID=A0A1G9THZ7_9FIRM|nr:CotA family spore coat protein [Romboutsia lituseburensis]CEH36192.1 Hypothetical protein RLITU_3634 [Romboutsia lituseburensis]SDM47158.1 hypothetical protein SAMN04515677_112117 [Romboutsia lituseburensis DSM 797]